MNYVTRHFILLLLFAPLSICSMATVPQIPGPTFPSLLTLCLKKITQLFTNKELSTSIVTQLPTDLQEKLQSHLREKFDHIITQAFLRHKFRYKYNQRVFTLENAPSCTNAPQSNIQNGHNFLYIYSKFNNPLTSLFNYVKCLPGIKSFYVQDDTFIQRTIDDNEITQYTTDLTRFNTLVESSYNMPLNDLLTMNSTSDVVTHQILIQKFLEKWQRQYAASIKKQKSERPAKKQKIS